MFMKDDKNKAATLILNKIKGPSPELEEAPQKEGAEQSSSIALESAAEEVFSAFESKSPAAFAEAMKAFVELCYEDTESEVPKE